MSNLTANEFTALRAWRNTDRDFDVLSFAEIQKRSRLRTDLVRRTVRAMARKGVTHFVRGCWTEDGDPAGSGYGLTREGRALMQDALEADPS